MKSPRAHSSSGFTIIEAMIVLSIAGFIMIVVLIAIPTLRRNQRNYARKNFAGLLAAQMESFRTNNAAAYPKDGTNGADQRCTFLQNYAVGGGPSITCTIDGDCAVATMGAYSVCFHTRDGDHDYIGDYDEVSIELAHGCNTSYSSGSDYIISESPTDNDYNRYVIWTALEGGNDPVCVDNVRRN